MKLKNVADSMMEVWDKYQDHPEEAILDVVQVNADLAKTVVYFCQLTDLISQAESNHFKAKQILKNQLEGAYFVEEREKAQIEFTDHGGSKPTDTLVKAKAEKRSKPLRKNLIKTHEDMQYAVKFWDAAKEMINFLKKTLDVQREEFNKAGLV